MKPRNHYSLTPNDIERFWSYVDKSGECWTWTGGTYTGGYGQFYLAGRKIHAHRAAYEIAHGPIPDGLHICHHCDTPACVRPDHLYAATHAQNMQDAIERGRFVMPPGGIGEKNGRAKLTESEVLEIRRLYASGDYLQRELADRYGVTQAYISKIVNRKNWTHLPQRRVKQCHR